MVTIDQNNNADSKKVKMLTFHWTVNFGGLLQACALQHEIKRIGFEPELINYYNKSELKSVSSAKRRLVQFVWDKVARVFFGRTRREKITQKFRDDYLTIEKQSYSDYKQLCEGYERCDCYAYVVGSDQVFNPDLTGCPDAYLLSFTSDNARKIAYAASFGKPSIPKRFEQSFEKGLPLFSSLSFREDAAVKLVKERFDIDSVTVMDPVFFLDMAQWRKIASERIIKDDYILCYYMNTADASIVEAIASMAAALAKKYNCKVVNIGKKEYQKLKFWENNLFDIGPSEFVSLIDNAKCVVTNSFHATAFSTIMHTPFYVPVNYSQEKSKRLSNRMECLVEMLGCADRLLACPLDRSTTDNAVDNMDMDFESIDCIAEKYISSSRKFLLDALEKPLGDE